MKFGNGRRGKSGNPGLTAAVGLCIAAVCLVAAATVINTRSDNKHSFISDYVTEETAPPWADSGVGETEVYIDEPADAEPVTAAETDAPDAVETEAVSDYPTVGEPDAEEIAAAEETAAAEEMTAQQLDIESAGVVPASAAVSFRMPLAGTVQKDFSGENLVYCSTMCDWRVHQGVDIAGEADCEVRAAADGIVVDFVEDMLYGYTAIIRQEDDSTLYYCGLTSVPMVTAGLEVHAGDVIGHLGTVPCEASEQPHLHLALMREGSFVDPLSLMGL